MKSTKPASKPVVKSDNTKTAAKSDNSKTATNKPATKSTNNPKQPTLPEVKVVKVEEEKKEDINREQYPNYLQSLLDTIQIYENTIERYRNIIERDARRFVFIEPTIDSLVPTEAKQTSFECVVCQTNQIQTVITPCMHACYCSGCAKTALRFSQDCPKCRRKVEKISPLYI